MMPSLVALALLVSQVAGPAPAKTPELTDVQRLTVLTTVQRFEIAQLRAQAAQRDLEVLLKSLQVKGYTLDLGTLVYTPVPVKSQP